MNLCSNTANEGDLLVGVDALSRQELAHPPHIIPAKILVLEGELDKTGAANRRIYLMLSLTPASDESKDD